MNKKQKNFMWNEKRSIKQLVNQMNIKKPLLILSIILAYIIVLDAITFAKEIDRTTYYDAQTKQSVEVVSDEISVKFKVGVSTETIEKTNEDLGVQVIKGMTYSAPQSGAVS